MVGIVTRRPVKKIRRGSLDDTKGLSFSLKWSWKVVFFCILGAVFFYLTYFLLKHTLFKRDYYVKKIDYSTQSLSFFDDPYLYRSIGKSLRSENFYVIKYFKIRKILSAVQQEYPIVKHIEVVYKGISTVAVKVDFYQPDFIAETPDKEFGVYQEFIFPLYTWNTLWNDVMRIKLPSYMSGTQTIAWLFFEISQKDLLEDIITLQTNIKNIESIMYIPWSLRIVVYLPKNKIVYVNLAKDIKKQIDNLLYLQLYYPNYNKVRIIDLWSLDDNKIIIQ